MWSFATRAPNLFVMPRSSSFMFLILLRSRAKARSAAQMMPRPRRLAHLWANCALPSAPGAGSGGLNPETGSPADAGLPVSGAVLLRGRGRGDLDLAADDVGLDRVDLFHERRVNLGFPLVQRGDVDTLVLQRADVPVSYTHLTLPTNREV